MDLNKLRNLTQEGQNELEKEVLQLCDPNQIAQKLINDLETSATNSAKNGLCRASSQISVWFVQHSGAEHTYSGPLGNCGGSVFALSKVLFNMVKNRIFDYMVKNKISENNIQIELRDISTPYNRTYYEEGEVIDVILTW